MRPPMLRRGDPGIAHTRGGTHHLDHFIDNLCRRTFCRTEERCQVEPDVHDTLLAADLGDPHPNPLPEGEGPIATPHAKTAAAPGAVVAVGRLSLPAHADAPHLLLHSPGDGLFRWPVES